MAKDFAGVVKDLGRGAGPALSGNPRETLGREAGGAGQRGSGGRRGADREDGGRGWEPSSARGLRTPGKARARFFLPWGLRKGHRHLSLAGWVCVGLGRTSTGPGSHVLVFLEAAEVVGICWGRGHLLRQPREAPRAALSATLVLTQTALACEDVDGSLPAATVGCGGR